MDLEITCSALILSDLGECEVVLVEMLTSIKNRVTKSAIRPGTIAGGTRNETCNRVVKEH